MYPHWEPLTGMFIYIYVRTLDTIQAIIQAITQAITGVCLIKAITGVCLIKDISNKGLYYFKYFLNHIFSFFHGLLFSFRYI
jgi:hypothetical protein